MALGLPAPALDPPMVDIRPEPCEFAAGLVDQVLAVRDIEQRTADALGVLDGGDGSARGRVATRTTGEIVWHRRETRRQTENTVRPGKAA